MGQQAAHIERERHASAHTYKVIHHDAMGQHVVKNAKSTAT